MTTTIITKDGREMDIQEALTNHIEIDWHATYNVPYPTDKDAPKPTLEDRVFELEKTVYELERLVKDLVWGPVYDNAYGAEAVAYLKMKYNKEIEE